MSWTVDLFESANEDLGRSFRTSERADDWKATPPRTTSLTVWFGGSFEVDAEGCRMYLFGG